MGTKIQPLWEVKEIYQGKQVLSYGFHVATEQEARALYERSHRSYPNSTLEASRVDGILTKNVRYLWWLKWRNYLDWAVLLLGVLGAGLSVFPSIKLDIQIAGVSLNVFAIIALVALVYTSFVGRYHGPDQQEVMRVLTLPIHHGRLSAPAIQRSDPQ